MWGKWGSNLIPRSGSFPQNRMRVENRILSTCLLLLFLVSEGQRRKKEVTEERETLLGEEMVFTSYLGTYSQGCPIAFYKPKCASQLRILDVSQTVNTERFLFSNENHQADN